MKTIHIYQLNENSPLSEFLLLFTKSNRSINDLDTKKNLMKELYDSILKHDNKFHYFFEPDLIIRIDSSECLDKVKKHLTLKKIKFVEYDYPIPKNSHLEVNESKKIYCYGEQDNKIVQENLDLFLTIFHAHSIAAITLNNDDHFEYMERTIHTCFNPRGYSRQDECDNLVRLASYKGKINQHK